MDKNSSFIFKCHVKNCSSLRFLTCLSSSTSAGFYLLGEAGGKLPSQTSQLSPPPKKKSFPEKKFKAISNKDLFEDDFKESVKVTNVQKCDFNQS